MLRDFTFRCPLPNGLHARPASRLAEVAGQFTSDVTLVNERSGEDANVKSALSIIAIGVKLDDSCLIRVDGTDAEEALAAIRDFVENVLPDCDEQLSMPAVETEIVLPRSLRIADVVWHAGTPVSRGIGQGVVVVVASGPSLPKELAHESVGSCDEEQHKVSSAVAAVRRNLKAKLAAQPGPTEAGILRAHLSIAGDVALAERLEELVSAGLSAGQAIVEAGSFFASRLEDADSAYVRERAVDVEDICQQLLEQVCGQRVQAASIELTEPSVVLAKNLAPRQFLSLDKHLLKGLVLERGGTTSHTVILARSFSIPTLTGVAGLRAKLPVGSEVIIDANLGIVITEINSIVRRYYERELRKHSRLRKRFAAHVHAPAITRDGRRLEVAANVATPEELAPAFEQGAEGIGLFRTEMLFMDRGAAPSEEEQFAVYTQAAQAADGRPVIIRTIDIGGDKPLPYLSLPFEVNPFLGYRGVRIYRDYQEMIDTQLRAILRASAFGALRVMVPMVCSVEEVRWVKKRLTEAQAELKAGGVAFDPAMPFGIMVEVPSVAFVLDQICAEVDFFSIGTNDLLQYFLAVDRDNDKVAGLYSARHPAFLRLLARIVEDARRHSRWVGMCGEMARDLQNLPLLIGLGLDEISVAAPDVPALKAAVTQLSAAECRDVFAAATACSDVAEVESVLATFHTRAAAARSLPEASLLEAELITVDSDSISREEVIKEIVDALHVAHRTHDAATVEEAVWAREEVHSTGLGHGFAIPHCKTDAMASNSIGVVRLKQPIEWDAVDDQPVECVILLAMRESDKDGTHMKVFSTLARKLMHEEFRERMLAAQDGDAILAYLTEQLELPT
ncbi:MAG: phosphoenolpyruvate--protein phosphotransferase [Planctomycetes bacterium]|nr:phosphoenolpyruvate--protein phosphotransferase [Planctomycetota bacterium]